MFGRSEIKTENKRYFVSNEYITKIKESYNTQRDISQNENFKKFPGFENTKLSNNQPLVIYRQPISANTHSFEFRMRNDLINNNQYITDGGYKKKLSKYSNLNIKFSKKADNGLRKSHCVSTTSKNCKKLFDLPKPEKLFHRTFKQKKSRPLSYKSFKKGDENKNIEKNKTKRKHEIKLKNKEDLLNNFMKELKRSSKKKQKKESEAIGSEVINRKKLDYLAKNNIVITDQEEKEEDNIKEEIIKDKKLSKILKSSSKNILTKNKEKNSNAKKSSEEKDENNKNLLNNKKDKKVYKPCVNQFEYIQKIKKELTKLLSPKENEKTNKN